MAAIQDEYKEKFAINKVKDSTVDPLTKRSRIQEVKKSFVTKKNSSIKTIFSITNTMMGSAIVVFPLIFSTSGLLTSLIVLCFVGAVSCKTCLLEIIHFKMSEMDFPDAIKRILGKKWFIAYSLCSVLLLYVTGMVYFTLICNMLYPFLKYILDSTGHSIAPMDSIEFGQFSFQYTGIIMIVVCFFLFSLKDLKVILKFGQYGIIAIMVFFVYIIIRGFMNIHNISTDNVKIFTYDVANLCGVFALSFFIHNIIIPIMKNNQEEDKNQRDVVLGYILTGQLYVVIGMFGTFSIAGVDLGDKKANTVLDYYTPDVGTAIIEILLFLQLLSVEPILWYVARSQFFNLIYKNEAVPQKYFILVNVIFSASCLLIQILNVDPTMIISLDGAICGFLLVYIIPIKMHLMCLYTDPHELQKSLLNDESALDAEDLASAITTTEDGAKISGLRLDKLMDESDKMKNAHACKAQRKNSEKIKHMSLQNLPFYIDKLYLMNKELGGKAKEEQGAVEADEFDSIKLMINENLYKTSKKMDEKMEKVEGFGKGAETLKIDIEIKDLFAEIEKGLGLMNEVLRRQAKNSKKYSKTEIENKEKLYGALRNRVKDLRELEKESANVSFGSANRPGETLTELKSRLMERPKNVEVRREMNEEEKQGMDTFKENDKKIDDFVDKIAVGVNEWKVKAQQMGEKIDETTIRIDKVAKEVDKATAELITTNKKLKTIVDKYRQPNKFCLDIVLIALLIGLIGVMIKLLAK